MKHVKAYAKVNLGLEVVRKRADGYHDLCTLFQSIDFFDSLTFFPDNGGQIVLEGTDPTIPWDERNLIYKAAKAVQDRVRASAGVRIYVEKNIPAGKGLGGGSSDAAMTLYSLNRLWGLGVEKNELKEMGKTLGADVPYFLEGGLCLGRARGDDLTPLDDPGPLWILLVLPEIFVKTSSVFERLAPLTSRGKESKIIRFLETRDYGVLENTLEETVLNLHPQIEEIKRLFYKLEAELSLISGSGSAVFGLYRDRERALKAYERMGEKYSKRLVRTLSRPQYWDSIEVGV
jgi:4-diphosphocytidyl-2-C-methyl-D-erythritol kinase